MAGFSNGTDWTLHTVRLGTDTHSIHLLHEALPDAGLGEAFVDQFSWTPGPDLTPAMAADAPSFTWPEPAQTWWRPLGYDGMNAVGDHAMVVTTGTRPSGSSRSERLTIPVTGPGYLRWRWRWTNHPVADQNGGPSPRSIMRIMEDWGGGAGGSRSPAFFCSLDSVRLRGLARWGTSIETRGWYEASLYVPAGQHSVTWEMARDSAVSGAVYAGVSGLLRRGVPTGRRGLRRVDRQSRHRRGRPGP